MTSADEYRFRIDAFTPATMPMARLAEYMTDLALLLGEPERVHFECLDEGSTVLVQRIQNEAAPKVRSRLQAVRAGDGPREAVKAFDSLDRRLSADNAIGVLAGPDENNVIRFPGRERPTERKETHDAVLHNLVSDAEDVKATSNWENAYIAIYLLLFLISANALIFYEVLALRFYTYVRFPHTTEVAVIVNAILLLTFSFAGIMSRLGNRADAQDEFQENRILQEFAKYQFRDDEYFPIHLFRRNQFNLLKYYRLNLLHNRTLFWVGLGSIASSLLIVAGTILAIHDPNLLMRLLTDAPEAPEPANDTIVRILTAVIGAVSAVMVNVVAALYLQMHKRAADGLAEFHRRLVQTNEMLFANVLASRISDPEPREKIFGELACIIAKRQTSESAKLPTKSQDRFKDAIEAVAAVMANKYLPKPNDPKDDVP